jgi:hypothetical protein
MSSLALVDDEWADAAPAADCAGQYSRPVSSFTIGPCEVRPFVPLKRHGTGRPGRRGSRAGLILRLPHPGYPGTERKSLLLLGSCLLEQTPHCLLPLRPHQDGLAALVHSIDIGAFADQQVDRGRGFAAGQLRPLTAFDEHHQW